MSKTITLSDGAAAELLAALTGASPAQPPVVQPPVVQPPVKATTYPVAKLTQDDKFYIFLYDVQYRSALRNVPGGHQLPYDLLTDNLGRRFSDASPQPAGTTNSPFLHNQIENAINSGGTNNAGFSTAKYAGPLKEIVANLIAAKLAGK